MGSKILYYFSYYQFFVDDANIRHFFETTKLLYSFLLSRDYILNCYRTHGAIFNNLLSICNDWEKFISWQRKRFWQFERQSSPQGSLFPTSRRRNYYVGTQELLRRDVGKWAPGEERDRRWNRLELGLRGDSGRKHGWRFKKSKRSKGQKSHLTKVKKWKWKGECGEWWIGWICWKCKCECKMNSYNKD